MTDVYEPQDAIFDRSLYGNFRTRKFTDIFPDYDTFEYLMQTMQNYMDEPLTVKSYQMLYYTLYARYGNSHIANSDENQFKIKLWAIVNQYGPTWQKKMDMQKKLRALTDDEILAGSRAIHNHAFNPSTAPTTEELDEINEQNTTKFNKAKPEGYSALYEILQDNVTDEFINRFKVLFLVIVEPELPLWYESEE